jgi:hypothetical protein
MPDILAPLVGFALTLLVFSYLVGDNPAYRFAVNFLAGLSLTYAMVVVAADVLGPRIAAPVLQAFGPNGDMGQVVSAIVPLALGTLILFKLSRRLAPWGNWGMAVLIGVGAGVAVGGALVGSLFGLTLASGASLAPRDGDPLASLLALVGLIGTVSTLLYFWYTGRPDTPGDSRPAPVRVMARVGQAFLMITFGALFGGALAASIATLIDRLGLLAQIVRGLGQ